jgi:hypothetical protein
MTEMTTMYQTFAGLLIPGGLGCFVWAYNLSQQTSPTLNPDIFILVGVISCGLGLLFLERAIENVREDKWRAWVEYQRKIQGRINMQTLVRSIQILTTEVRGLREDLRNRDKS